MSQPMLYFNWCGTCQIFYFCHIWVLVNKHQIKFSRIFLGCFKHPCKILEHLVHLNMGKTSKPNIKQRKIRSQCLNDVLTMFGCSSCFEIRLLRGIFWFHMIFYPKFWQKKLALINWNSKSATTHIICKKKILKSTASMSFVDAGTLFRLPRRHVEYLRLLMNGVLDGVSDHLVLLQQLRVPRVGAVHNAGAKARQQERAGMSSFVRDVLEARAIVCERNNGKCHVLCGLCWSGWDESDARGHWNRQKWVVKNRHMSGSI